MVATAIFIKPWIPIREPIPAAITIPAVSFATRAMDTQRIAIRISSKMTTAEPIKPSSSPMIAKIKSVWDSGRKLPFLTDAISVLLSPFPQSCPDPIAMTEFNC